MIWILWIGAADVDIFIYSVPYNYKSWVRENCITTCLILLWSMIARGVNVWAEGGLLEATSSDLATYS